MRPSVAARRSWRTALRALRAECPLPQPVRVVIETAAPPRGPSGRMIAWSLLGDGGFRIVLRSRVRDGGRIRRVYPSEYVESLAHEWAHCLAWHSDLVTLEDHGPSWGVAYAACYRTVVED